MVSEQAKIGFGVALLVGIIVTLTISVVTLVKVNNNNKETTDLVTPPATTTTVPYTGATNAPTNISTTTTMIPPLETTTTTSPNMTTTASPGTTTTTSPGTTTTTTTSPGTTITTSPGTTTTTSPGTTTATSPGTTTTTTTSPDTTTTTSPGTTTTTLPDTTTTTSPGTTTTTTTSPGTTITTSPGTTTTTSPGTTTATSPGTTTTTTTSPDTTTTTSPGTTTTTLPDTTTTTSPGTTTTTTTSIGTLTTSTTMMPITTTTPALNIPPPPTGPTEPSYVEAAQFLSNAINPTGDPCNGFYEFACGRFSGPMYFNKIQVQAITDIAQKLNDKTYITDNASLPLRQLSWYYDACKKDYLATYADNGDFIGPKDNSSILLIVNEFLNYTGLQFPMFSNGAVPNLTPELLGKTLGYLSGSQMIDTLISFGVDTNWRDPHGPQSYAAFVDQPTVSQGNEVYIKAWDTYRPGVINLFTKTLGYYRSVYPIVNEEQFAADVEAMVDLEYTLVMNYSSDENTRRKYMRSYNPHSLNEAQQSFPVVNWDSYFQAISFLKPQIYADVISKPNFKFIVMEKEMLSKFSVDWTAIASPKVLINYFYLRLFLANDRFLPRISAASDTNEVHAFQEKLGKRRRSYLPEMPLPSYPVEKEDTVSNADFKCAGETINALQYVNARAYVDARFVNAALREVFREKVRNVISGILMAFRSQIDELNWMSTQSKMGAYSKIDNLVINVAIPDFILDDDKLSSYYADLPIQQSTIYIRAVEMVNDFNIISFLNQLKETLGSDRLDFNGPPALVNAWYQPELNSITFPLAILQPPFFDPNGLAAINYGALGIVGGHELTHGFDDEGVQWDGTGVLSTWMDDASGVSFQQMADCVINEYSGFCPLNDSLPMPHCIDGAQTQGENIADNGGIHAAFRAYRNYASFYGSDPQLPDSIIGQLNQDQLFFLSFSLIWCSGPINWQTIQRQLLLDVHSPYKYRVIGTVQNFPAFRNAFNCPINSTNAPAQHCDVWVSNLTTSTGIPPTPPTTVQPYTGTTTPGFNIPTPPIAPTVPAYTQAAQFLSHAINPKGDPCNGYYEFACGEFSSDMHFDLIQGQAMVDIANKLNDKTYINDNAPLPLRQLSWYYEACKKDYVETYDADGTFLGPKDNSSILLIVGEFLAYTGLQFPMFSNGAVPNLTPELLGKTLGYLSGSQMIDTLVSFGVDTNWRDPHGPQSYAAFLDQPTVSQGNEVYLKAWGTYRPRIINLFTKILGYYSSVVPIVNEGQFAKDVEDMVDLEYKLVVNYSTGEETRRQYLRSYNPHSVNEAQQNYSFIDWNAYFQAVTFLKSDIYTDVISKPNFKFIVMEKDMLKKLSQNLMTLTDTKTLLNYFYLRLLLANQQFLPRPRSVSGEHDIRQIHPFQSKLGKKRRPYRPEMPLPKYPLVKDNLGPADFNCAGETIEVLQYVNARAYVDARYPNAAAREVFREQVRKVISGILVAFRSQIDELNWMSTQSKMGAYSKIDNLVINVAIPDFILDDDKLSSYYADLPIQQSTIYIRAVEMVNNFNIISFLNQLKETKGADRLDFNGPPALVNAWYQPELNSITFPLAILQAPFFDPEGPVAMNYGALGVVGGHELTHGFDDEGVQWDGTGVLSTWMDDASGVSFQQMADCVINEYSGFCPLNDSLPMPHCIDGAQTQGENIADNGGIHAASRAYRNYVNLNGRDPQLPDPLIAQLTQEQIFFLSFSLVWCSGPIDWQAIQRQLLLDVHSPYKYRVIGTVQNFPAFRNAFNCPLNSANAPAQHCDVWVSDVSTSTGIPPTPPTTVQPYTGTTTPGFNIPTPPIAPTVPAYTQAAQFLSHAINPKGDPCNGYYEFACGEFSSDMHFDLIQGQAMVDIANKLNDKTYINDNTPHAIRQLSWYFEACKKDYLATYDADGNFLGPVNSTNIDMLVQEFVNNTGLSFPMFTNGAVSILTPELLGKTMGYLSGSQMIDTLVSFGVDTNWHDPHGPQSYAVFIDQPTVSQGNEVYLKAWGTYRPRIINLFTKILGYYSSVVPIVNEGQFAKDVEDMVDLEYKLVVNYSTGEETRRQYLRSYNPHSVNEAQQNYSFIDWNAYFQAVTFLKSDIYTDVISKPNFKFIVMEKDMLKKLSQNLMTLTDTKTLLNYFYLRLLLANQQFLPRPRSVSGEHDIRQIHPFQSKLARKRQTYRPEMPLPKYPLNKDNIGPADFNCAGETIDVMQYANARAYVDARFPNATALEMYREQVRRVVSGILIAFRSQIDQLSWMSTQSKLGAYSKIDNLVINIAIPDFILDDDKLSDYYADLSIAQSTIYARALEMTTEFNIISFLKLLKVSRGSDRLDFNGPPALVNAWYQPELNSITFPLAILQPPFFDPNGPAAVNYGALGVVGGHELTHGFDDEGVQWDGTGVLSKWLDDASEESFLQMADCVIQEYNHFCPLNDSLPEPRCIDGSQTQGENIADNGGIHAAFRAYRNYVNFYGKDPQLPDLLMGQLTQEQIFFLSFSLVWCSGPIDWNVIQRQLLLDVHSPYKYRVIGTVQNFPAFRNAFNCPLNSANAPAQHCDVWVSDVSTSTGIPPTPPALNLPTPDTGSNAAYNSSVALFQASINTGADACNDFYGYACGRYDQPISFRVVDAKNFKTQADQMSKDIYKNTSTPSALKKTIQFFEACKDIQTNWTGAIADGLMVVRALTGFAATTRLTFTMMEAQGTDGEMPAASVLGTAIGYLSDAGVETLLSMMIDTNWKREGTDAYMFFVDQPTLYFPLTYYDDAAWTHYTESRYRNLIKDLFRRYAMVTRKTLNETILNDDVTSLINLELLLARNYSTDETTRRQFNRNWNVYNMASAQESFTFITWSDYITAVSMSAPGVNLATRRYVIMEPDMLIKLGNAITSGVFTGTQVVNYFFFRLLASQSVYLPQLPGRSASTEDAEYHWHKPLLGRPRMIREPDQPRRLPEDATADEIAVQCAEETVRNIQYANARFFVDALYPTPADRDNIRKSVGKIIDDILDAFQTMLSQLPWMSSASATGANGKVTNLMKNIAYPNWIMNDTELDSYHSTLIFDANDTYVTMMPKLQKFNRYLQLNYLISEQIQQDDFLSAPGIVNAWYQPELNSITFPAGILQAPFFDPGWPASVNYGGIGLVAGHELTHGFDDQGVQWNGTGVLTTWMDNQTLSSFTRMANCVVNEYSGFCPLDGQTFAPHCVNGAQTQGENIADNGGIHAAFRSFRQQVELNGPDPRLPDAMIRQFSHEQLFFLSFGQTWCRAPLSNDDLYRQLMVDSHSPAELRILGTIQNFPAFRSAFNCPLNSTYTPQKHCNVWVLDN